MTVYLVWEIISDYPEAGGGEYLEDIFLSYDKAKIFLEKKQEELKKSGGGDNNTFYKIEPFEIEK